MADNLIAAALQSAVLSAVVYGGVEFIKSRRQARSDGKREARLDRLGPAEIESVSVRTSNEAVEVMGRAMNAAEQRAKAAEKRAEMAERQAAKLELRVQGLERQVADLNGMLERRRNPSTAHDPERRKRS